MSPSSSTAEVLSPVEEAFTTFDDAWPRALTAFSPYTRLSRPIYCRTVEDEKREKLSGSFAMIRMRDDRIVISLRQVVEMGLQAHAEAILAHEVGHYVHAPGTLLEHIKLHDRIRRTLPQSQAQYAGLVANLYTDLLLNDRLQRSCGVDIAGVYEALRSDEPGPLWSFYVRIYERLWRLSTGTLAPEPSVSVDGDAELGARIVRIFRDRWMEGAASFTKLVEPYLEDLKDDTPPVPAWLDTAGTSVGDQIPDGLTDDDFDPTDVLHPALDGRITGDEDGGDEDGEGSSDGVGATDGRATKGDGRPDDRKVKRGPREYLDLLRSLGVKREPKDLVAQYYRELAMPHVIPFPGMRIERAGDPLPEGLDVWEPGSPLDRVDWLETVLRSPLVIPGITTVQRSYGTTEGGEPEIRPPDLYVGIDCSGSMGNPSSQLAYPIVAGAVLALSGLRAGARIMACLSGEYHGRGEHLETDGFIRDERAILGVLTDYLGTGASFGLPRLVETFVKAPERTRPVHVLVVSDSDLFREIDGTEGGWDYAARAVERAGGGASAVLRLWGDADHYAEWLAKLHAAGFDTYLVSSEEDLVDFARAFARRTFAFEESP